MLFCEALSDIRYKDPLGYNLQARREAAIHFVTGSLKVTGAVDENHPIVNALLCANAVVVTHPINPAAVAEIFSHMLRAWEEYQKH
ncbi:MAG: hypothetical protein ABL917_00530 [Parcubacteria group bacterium]